MTDELITQIASIRQAIRLVRDRMAAPDADLGHIMTALDRLIIEHGGAVGLRSRDGAAQTVASELAYWTAYDEEIARRSAEAAPEPSKADTADIDRAALVAFLRDAVPGESGLEIADARIASVGYSKKTLLIGLKGNRTLPGALALRIDQPANLFSTTVVDEYPVVKLLFGLGVPVPQPFALESSGTVLGMPFIAFARVRGTNISTTTYFVRARNDALTANVAATLAQIHAAPIESVAKAATRQPAGQSYMEFELDRFEARWRKVGRDIPLVELAFRWLRDHLADSLGATTIVHGDFSYANILADKEKIFGVLDWEFAHIGNPAYDVAWFGCGNANEGDGNGGVERFQQAYARAGGRLPSRKELNFYTVWGHLRMAIFAAQSDAGWRKGTATEVRYGLTGPIYVTKTLKALAETLLPLS